MDTIELKTQNLLSEFNQVEKWDDKYKIIIKKGKSLSLSADLMVEDNKVKGCQSQVWVVCELKEGRLYYQADSDAVIVKGLVAILIEFYSGLTPEQIVKDQMEIIKLLGLDSHLSPSRTNGLYSMIKKMKYYAIAYQAMLAN